MTTLALLPAALFTLTSCSSTSKPPPAVGSSRMTYTKGVPGGVIVQTFKMTATVTAIDQAKRKATLLGPDGKKFTVKVGPEAVNFDQVRVGDRVNATVTERMVVPPSTRTAPLRLTERPPWWRGPRRAASRVAWRRKPPK